MLIMSVKMTKLKLLIIAAVVVVIAGAIILALPKGDVDAIKNNNVSFKNIGTNEQRIAFLKAFGWEVNIEPLEVVEAVIPEEFTPVYEKYNELQKSQGLDLSKYKGKRVKRWTYLVTNYNTDKKIQVHANLIIYNNKVIAGDICSTELDGFMHGFDKPEAVRQTSATPEDVSVNASVDNEEVDYIGEALSVNAEVEDWEYLDESAATYEG